MMSFLRGATCIVVLAFIAFTGFVAQAQAPQFFSSLPDVPLMQGLEEYDDQTLIFDKPDGRIIEVFADLHRLSVSEVTSYYESVLPAFGWVKTAQNVYERDAERLQLSADRDADGGVLHITVMPL